MSSRIVISLVQRFRDESLPSAPCAAALLVDVIEAECGKGVVVGGGEFCKCDMNNSYRPSSVPSFGIACAQASMRACLPSRSANCSVVY